MLFVLIALVYCNKWSKECNSKVYDYKCSYLDELASLPTEVEVVTYGVQIDASCPFDIANFDYVKVVSAKDYADMDTVLPRSELHQGLRHWPRRLWLVRKRRLAQDRV